MSSSISVGVSARRRKSKRRSGLSKVHEARLRAQLRRTTPSEPWVEAQFKKLEDRDAEGREIVVYYHDPQVFPPGGQETKMVRCPRCGVFTPPVAMEGGACLDHASHDAWGPSPSAVTIRQLQFYNLRMEQVDLLPEDERSLRKEILAAERKMRNGTGARKSRSRKTPFKIV